MSSEMLRKCPFCGSKAEVQWDSSTGNVSCTNEDCYATSTWFDSDDAAEVRSYVTQRWNRRLTASPQPPAMALDMPDAPGWWAFEGHHHFYNGLVGELIQTMVQVIDTSDGLYGFGERIGGKVGNHLVGKWTRVYMPREQKGATTHAE